MTLLDAHIDFAGTQAGALDPSRTDESHQRDVEDAMALWVSLFQRLEHVAERKLAAAAGEWREGDARSMIPAYRHWYDGATKTREHIRTLRSGACDPRACRSSCAYMRARVMAVDFDAILASLRRPDDPSCWTALEDLL